MKHYRLWINASGSPLYVECLDVDLDQDAAKRISDLMQTIRTSDQTFILDAEWEIRVLAA